LGARKESASHQMLISCVSVFNFGPEFSALFGGFQI